MLNADCTYSCEHFTVKNIWHLVKLLWRIFSSVSTHSAGISSNRKSLLKSILQEHTGIQLEYNKRIDNLFVKNGIFSLAFPSYHGSVPRGCERKCTEPELLLLIKAVNQESDVFPFYLSLSGSVCVTLIKAAMKT